MKTKEEKWKLKLKQKFVSEKLNKKKEFNKAKH